MLGRLLNWAASAFATNGGGIWEARASLAQSKVSYAELAGHLARLNHVKQDQEKGLRFYKGQAEKSLEKGDTKAAREHARKYLEYEESLQKTKDGIQTLQDSMRKLASDIQSLDARINGMMAQAELHNAKMGVINTKASLNQNEMEWEAANAKADALEEMAGLSIKDELFVDQEMEEELSKDAVDKFLASLKAKKRK